MALEENMQGDDTSCANIYPVIDASPLDDQAVHVAPASHAGDPQAECEAGVPLLNGPCTGKNLCGSPLMQQKNSPDLIHNAEHALGLCTKQEDEDLLAENSTETKKTNTQENGGTRAETAGKWGWMCVLGAIINQFIFSFFIRSFGVTYNEMLDKFQSSPSVTIWPGALNMAFSGLFGPVSTYLIGRFSCRTVVISGAIISSIGSLASAFAPNIYVTYLTYGLVNGFGMCLIYTPGFIAINQYFTTRKATAMGVASFGSALGCLASPPILHILYEKVEYKWTMVVLAAVCIQGCFGGALIRPINKSNKTDKDTGEKVKKRKVNACDMSLFRDLNFLSYFLFLFGLAFVMSANSAFIPVLAMEKGHSAILGTSLLSVVGAGNLVGGLLLGPLLDVPVIRRRRVYVYNFYNVVVAVTCILTPLFAAYWSFLLLVFVRASALSVLMSQRATILSDIIAGPKIPAAFGLLLFSYALGTLLGRASGGLLMDYTGTYAYSFYIGGGLNILGSVIFLLAYTYTSRKRKCKEKDEPQTVQIKEQKV